MTARPLLQMPRLVSAIVATISSVPTFSSTSEEGAGDSVSEGLRLPESLDARDPWIAKAPGLESNEGGSFPFLMRGVMVS